MATPTAQHRPTRRNTVGRALLTVVVGAVLALTGTAGPAGARQGLLGPPEQTHITGTDGQPVQDPVIALTFDDGPDPEFTPQILAVLRQHQVTATFFMLGEEARQHPDLVRQVAADGHEIGGHTWSHPSLPDLPRPAAAAEIQQANDLLTSLTSTPVRYVRPPFGASSPDVEAVVEEHGAAVSLWSVDPRDWQRTTTDEITSHVLADAAPGTVVLLHDGGGDRSATVAALPRLISELQQRGYRFTRLDGTPGSPPASQNGPAGTDIPPDGNPAHDQHPQPGTTPPDGQPADRQQDHTASNPSDDQASASAAVSAPGAGSIRPPDIHPLERWGPLLITTLWLAFAVHLHPRSVRRLLHRHAHTARTRWPFGPPTLP